MVLHMCPRSFNVIDPSKETLERVECPDYEWGVLAVRRSSSDPVRNEPWIPIFLTSSSGEIRTFKSASCSENRVASSSEKDAKIVSDFWNKKQPHFIFEPQRF